MFARVKVKPKKMNTEHGDSLANKYNTLLIYIFYNFQFARPLCCALVSGKIYTMLRMVRREKLLVEINCVLCLEGIL